MKIEYKYLLTNQRVNASEKEKIIIHFYLDILLNISNNKLGFNVYKNQQKTWQLQIIISEHLHIPKLEGYGKD